MRWYADARRRCLLLALLALAGFLWGRASAPDGLSDWLWFEYAARVLLGWHRYAVTGGTPLHLYANNPTLQFGPPAALVVVTSQWLPSATSQIAIDVVMTMLGVGAVIGIDRALAPQGLWSGPGKRAGAWFLAEGGSVLCWAYLVGSWHHVDDLLAVGLAGVATGLIARARPWWLAAILLGTAAAAKPWAIVMLPVLLGLPRADRARATLLTLATAALWWAPFVLADPRTMQALGGYSILPLPGSTLYLFGIHGQVQHWLRPAQFVIGTGVAVLAARRRGWWAAPLAGLAVRVLTDPYAWLYYGLGPVLFALVWDLGEHRYRCRRLPVLTVATLAVEFVLPIAVGSGHPAFDAICACAKLAWGLGVLALVAWPRRTDTPTDPDLSTATSISAKSVVTA